jgi:threonine aldolase
MSTGTTAALAEVLDAAHGMSLAARLDGARICNAPIQGAVAEREF